MIPFVFTSKMMFTIFYCINARLSKRKKQTRHNWFLINYSGLVYQKRVWIQDPILQIMLKDPIQIQLIQFTNVFCPVF